MQKEATTVFVTVMVTVHVVLETESHPVQPLKTEGKSGVAVRVTMVPRSYVAEQVGSQLMPPGLDVTVLASWLERLVLLTVRVALTVKLLALVVPSGVVTLSGPVVAPAGTVV
jgi:hypothetical protein